MIARITGIIIFLVTIASAGYTAYGQYTTAHADPVLTTSTSQFFFPPFLATPFKKELNEEQLPKVNEYYKYISGRMNVGYQTLGSLRNKGSKEATHIRIDFPGAKVVILTDANSHVLQKIYDKSDIEIEKLLPDEKLFFRVWSDNEDSTKAGAISGVYADGRIEYDPYERYLRSYVERLDLLTNLAPIFMGIMLIFLGIAFLWSIATSKQ
jgi:hypothetical protein